MRQGILFDLDGTLWDSSRQVVESWNVVLEQQAAGDNEGHTRIYGTSDG